MTAPYLTDVAASIRLEEFGFDTESVTVGSADLRIASDELDAKAPFYGVRPENQERQFPRIDPETGEAAESIPDAILDWVSLRAYQLASDETPAVKSEGAGRVSVTYFSPKMGPVARRMATLLRPYLRTYGHMGEVRRALGYRAHDAYPGRW